MNMNMNINIRYVLKDILKDLYTSPGIYACVLLGASIIVPLSEGNILAMVLWSCWVVFIGQIFAWDGRIEERNKLKDNKAYRDKFMEQCHEYDKLKGKT